MYYFIHYLLFCNQMEAEGSPKVYCAGSGKQFPFHVSCFRITDESVKEATYRVFKIGDIYVLVL